MREIKFRAWHEGNNGFSRFTLAEIWKNGFHVAQSTEYGNKDDIKRGADGLYATEEFFGSEFMGNVFCLNIAEWEQFTGLHDKNGKEIYEGDIVAGCNGSINGADWPVEPFEIGWSNCGFNVPMWGVNDNQDSTHWIEVIGNIHENPELLEDLS